MRVSTTAGGGERVGIERPGATGIERRGATGIERADVADLLRRARQGEEGAAADLVVRCRSELVRFARSRRADDPESLARPVVAALIEADDADDLITASQVWARLLRRRRGPGWARRRSGRRDGR